VVIYTGIILLSCYQIQSSTKIGTYHTVHIMIAHNAIYFLYYISPLILTLVFSIDFQFQNQTMQNFFNRKRQDRPNSSWVFFIPSLFSPFLSMYIYSNTSISLLLSLNILHLKGSSLSWIPQWLHSFLTQPQLSNLGVLLVEPTLYVYVGHGTFGQQLNSIRSSWWQLSEAARFYRYYTTLHHWRQYTFASICIKIAAWWYD